MKESILKMAKAIQPFFIIQFKIQKNSYWHTVQAIEKGDAHFDSLKSAQRYIESDDFKSWHPIEYRICHVDIKRYKKVQ